MFIKHLVAEYALNNELSWGGDSLLGGRGGHRMEAGASREYGAGPGAGGLARRGGPGVGGGGGVGGLGGGRESMSGAGNRGSGGSGGMMAGGIPYFGSPMNARNPVLTFGLHIVQKPLYDFLKFAFVHWPIESTTSFAQVHVHHRISTPHIFPWIRGANIIL